MSPMSHEAIPRHAWIMATASERKDAREWYQRANRLARGLSERYGYSVDQSAAVIAWLSPGTPWPQNQLDAEQFCKAGGNLRRYKPATYRNNARRARAVLVDGELGFPPTAPKVSAFYQCIRNPLQSERVCIDRWMVRVHGLGERLSPNTYRMLESAYLEAAERLGVEVAALQALIWIRARETWLQKTFQWE